MSAPFKRCSCGRTFTEAEWAALKSIGVQRFGTHVGGSYQPDAEIADLLMKNCSCGSTMAVEIPAHAEAA